MGDIHGAYKAMMQCLERAGFDYLEDTLIQIGDLVDGYDEVYLCVEELLKIKNLVTIKGNHDDWFTEFIQTGNHPAGWAQGGEGTAISYLRLTNKEGLTLALRPQKYKYSLIPPQKQKGNTNPLRIFY